MVKKSTRQSPYADKLFVVRDHIGRFVDRETYEREQRAELKKNKVEAGKTKKSKAKAGKAKAGKAKNK